MEYTLVQSGSSTGLTGYVNERFKKGWELYGDPNVSYSKGKFDNSAIYIQAMTKKNED
jgi:hypothetical protein